jgi:starvation-inducible outer membrane lipoprotein
MTVGDQRDRSGRLQPLHTGHHFLTVAGRFQSEDTHHVFNRYPWPTVDVAEAGHFNIMRDWETREL